MKVEIATSAHGGGTLHLDGYDATGGVRGFTLECQSGEAPTLFLDLLFLESGARADAHVQVHPGTEDLLVRLGWTPPTPAPTLPPGADQPPTSPVGG